MTLRDTFSSADGGGSLLRRRQGGRRHVIRYEAIATQSGIDGRLIVTHGNTWNKLITKDTPSNSAVVTKFPSMLT